MKRKKSGQSISDIFPTGTMVALIGICSAGPSYAATPILLDSLPKNRPFVLSIPQQVMPPVRPDTSSMKEASVPMGDRLQEASQVDVPALETGAGDPVYEDQILRDLLAAERAAAENVPLPVSDVATAKSTGVSYIDAREAMAGKLVDGSATYKDQIRYAEVLLSHLLLKEAESVLLDVQKTRPDDPYVGALMRAAELLDGKKERKKDPVFRWDDGSVWGVLENSLQNGTLSSRDLQDAAMDLKRQSATVAGALSPMLYDLALRRKDERLARGILEITLQTTDLAGTPVFLLMQGRLALLSEDEQAAFDLFAAAAEDPGLTGVQATLALADMATTNTNRSVLPQALELLLEVRNEWRGGDVGLDVLEKIAEIAEEIPDIPAAIEVMSEIRREHADTPASRLAEIRMPILTARLKGELADPDEDLAHVVTTVRRLAPAMEGFSEWPDLKLILARRLARAGLSEAAISEYRSLRYEASALGAGYQMEEAALIEEAELLSRSGRMEDLNDLLDVIELPARRSLARRHLVLRIEADRPDVMEDPEAIIAAYPDDEEILAAMLRKGIRDENNALIAAAAEAVHRAGGTLSWAEEAEYIRAKSSLGLNPELGVAISTTDPDVSPLSRETADEILKSSDPVISWPQIAPQ